MPPADFPSAAAPRERKHRRNAILHWAGYLTVAGVAVAQLLELPVGPRFWWIAGLLAAFAACLSFVFFTERYGEKAIFLVSSLVASVIVVAIMVWGAVPIYGAILFFVICTIVGMRMPLGVSIAWVASATAALLVCLLVTGDKYWLSSMLSYGAGFFAFIAFAVAFRRSLQAQAESGQLLAELTRAQGRLRDMAVMDERQRLAREMHDAVGHRLTAAAVLLEGAARLIPTEPERAAQMVDTSRTQVRQGLDELRAAVRALHTDLPGAQTLPEVLAALVDVFAQGAEAAVTLDLTPGLPEPDPDRKLVLIRTAQEALTNVQKHAAATRVSLGLRADGDAYILTCRDNGRGLGPASSTDQAPGGRGFGLGNLRARAAVFGGSVDLEPAVEGGAQLRLVLPASGAARGNPAKDS